MATVFKSPYLSVPIPSTDFASFVLHGRQRPHKAALIDAPTGRTLTFAELSRQADALASGLFQRGLRQGDVISEVRDGAVDGLADFYRKLWESGSAGAEIPMRVVRDGRETWLRVKSADRGSFLKKPQLQ